MCIRDRWKYPGGLVREDGPYSGDEFYQDVIRPVISRGEPIKIDLDGIAGMTTGFAREAFGNVPLESSHLVSVSFTDPELEYIRDLIFEFLCIYNKENSNA